MNNGKHYEVMKDFILFLNSRTQKFILKGGTSLMFCYGLDRFSEDIDLDGFEPSFFKYIDEFVNVETVKFPEISSRKAKDTDTVKRAFIHYDSTKNPLKIEVSYRTKYVGIEEYSKINGIIVYNIENILNMKINAFNHRDKIRDLYDIVFIYHKYRQYISNMTIMSLRDAVAFKGIDQFDYLIQNQEDSLIDNNKLAEGFLSMYFDLGLR